MDSQQTDEEIAAAVQNGDSDAFGVLVQRYEQKLLRYGGKFLANGEDLKDLVQEIFIKAYANIRSFDAHRRFSPWMYRIAHNEFINAGKKRWREKIFSFNLDMLFPHPAAREVADAEVNRRDIRRMLDACLAEIGSKYRESLVLYYFEDMGYREIAEILHIPVSTVGVRLQRGRIALKKIFVQLHGDYIQREK